LAVSDVIDPALLEEALRLLETDPIFRKVRGKLEPGSTSGSVVLKVEVEEANQLGGSVSFDNYSPPALGSERLGAGLQVRNLTGNGDILSANYFTPSVEVATSTTSTIPSQLAHCRAQLACAMLLVIFASFKSRSKFSTFKEMQVCWRYLTVSL
jgi:hemolysin activation/secretion protein